MMKFYQTPLIPWIFLPLILMTFFIGCSSEPDKKQAVLTVNGIPVTVEVASTPQERYMGYRFRKAIPPGTGMIFLFPDENYRSFVMTDVPVPINLAYIDGEGVIFEIIDMKPMEDNPVWSSRRAVYVLEVAGQWFRKNNIVTGMKVEGLLDAKQKYPPR